MTTESPDEMVTVPEDGNEPLKYSVHETSPSATEIVAQYTANSIMLLIFSCPRFRKFALEP
jgi:hypothetical protein